MKAAAWAAVRPRAAQWTQASSQRLIQKRRIQLQGSEHQLSDIDGQRAGGCRHTTTAQQCCLHQQEIWRPAPGQTLHAPMSGPSILWPALLVAVFVKLQQHPASFGCKDTQQSS